MTTVRLDRHGWVLGLACACGPSVVPSGGGTGSAGGATGSTATSGPSTATSTTGSAEPGTTDATSSPAADSTPATDSTSGSTGTPCDLDMCSPNLCPGACEPTVECSEFLYQCGCDCPSDCHIEQVACDLAAESTTPPDDCGVVTTDDDLSAWATVRQCVLDHAANGAAFKAVFHLQGLDSWPSEAWVGQVGDTYETSVLFQDLGGIPGITTVSRDTCTSIEPLGGCQVSYDNDCIQCIGFTPAPAACGP